MSSLRTVQEIHAAFGRGDVATILAKLARFRQGVDSHQHRLAPQGPSTSRS